MKPNKIDPALLKDFEDPTAIQKEDRFMLHLEVKDQQITVSTKGALLPEIAINVLASAILTVAEKTDDMALANTSDPKDFNEHQQHIFDFLNLTFTGILRQYAPHLELRPNLTADAIRIAENKILDEMDKTNNNTDHGGKIK